MEEEILCTLLYHMIWAKHSPLPIDSILIAPPATDEVAAREFCINFSCSQDWYYANFNREWVCYWPNWSCIYNFSSLIFIFQYFKFYPCEVYSHVNSQDRFFGFSVNSCAQNLENCTYKASKLTFVQNILKASTGSYKNKPCPNIHECRSCGLLFGQKTYHLDTPNKGLIKWTIFKLGLLFQYFLRKCEIYSRHNKMTPW